MITASQAADFIKKTIQEKEYIADKAIRKACEEGRNVAYIKFSEIGIGYDEVRFLREKGFTVHSMLNCWKVCW